MTSANQEIRLEQERSWLNQYIKSFEWAVSRLPPSHLPENMNLRTCSSPGRLVVIMAIMDHFFENSLSKNPGFDPRGHQLGLGTRKKKRDGKSQNEITCKSNANKCQCKQHATIARTCKQQRKQTEPQRSGNN